MYYLLYASTAVERMEDEQLESLLEVSRRNNAAINVSGMLLYYDGSFIQFIEGEKADVIDLFERITQDPRHFGVFVLDQGEADRRALPEWKMGYTPLSAEDRKTLGTFDLTREALEKELDPELPRSVISMMRTFYKTANRYEQP